MLVDIGLISPIRDTASSQGAKRRREERERSQKVLPRRQNREALNQDQPSRGKDRGVNAYA
ncbi:MAG: hypothetical protein ACOZHQ_06245 [Thermodesulfobacteriota bacterium]